MTDLTKQEKFKARVFIGKDSKPYMAKQSHCNFFQGDVIFVYYLHPDNKWVTIKQIPLDDGHLVLNNLTEQEQEQYPKFKDINND